MFTGKGGVGKTTCSAATALHRVAPGTPVMLISTDATPSLKHIFETGGAGAVEGLPGLTIREIGEAEVRQMWDEKFGREVYQVFSAFVDIAYDEFVVFMTSVLPGLGEEFMVDYIRELALKGDYAHIIWDTAPLGQTLGLLATPALLTEHLRLAPRIYSRLRAGRGSRQPVLEIIRRWEALSAANLEFLRQDVAFSMVTIPEALAVAQLAGTFRELEKYRLAVQSMIINNVVKIEESWFLQTKARQQREYLAHIRREYGHLKLTELPMFPREVKGLERLREVEKILFQGGE